MASTDGSHAAAEDGSRDAPGPDARGSDTSTDRHHDRPAGGRTESDASRTEVEQRVITKRAKTSALATFALVLGLLALVCVLTIVLTPFALVLGIIGILLGLAGTRATRKPGVTGKWLAVAGVVMSVIALLLSLAALIGLTTFFNDQGAVERVEQQLEQWRDRLPQDVEVPST